MCTITCRFCEREHCTAIMTSFVLGRWSTRRMRGPRHRQERIVGYLPRRSAGLTFDWRSPWAHKVIPLLFFMVLSLSLAIVDSECQIGQVMEGYLPNDVKDNNVYIPVPNILAFDECVSTCCKSASCDLAWMVEGTCYMVQCTTAQTCRTRFSEDRPDSRVVAVSDQAASQQCIPGFEDCSFNEVCEQDSLTCQCRLGYSRDITGQCAAGMAAGMEPARMDDTHASEPGSLNPYDLSICASDEDCQSNQFCFGLDNYKDGICAPDSLRDVDLPSSPQSTPVVPTTEESAQTRTQLSTMASDVREEGDTTTNRLVTSSLVEVPVKKTGGAGVDGEGAGNDTEISGGPAEGAGNDSNGNKPSPSSSPPSSAFATAPSLHEPQPSATAHSPASTSLSSLPATSKSPAVTSPTSTAVASRGTPPMLQLTVSLGDGRVLQLPKETSVTLHAFVIPADPPRDQPYAYEYEVVTKPPDSTVQMSSDGREDAQMQFSHLSAGFYQFKVTVTGSRAYGAGQLNVTVMAPPRVNQAPVALIQPAMQVVTLPNSDTILDGSGSTDDDDDRIAFYSWEQVQGPVDDHEISGDQDTLQLTSLQPGVYLIRLTVTDYDGASNSTIANVTVRKEEDYKPHAYAGPDVEIKLPVDFATLNASQSSDDHSIESYEWSRIQGKVADMTGTSSRILHLTGLEEGTYVYQVTVTDGSGQTDTDQATVIVKPEKNMPPTANVGPDKELSLPTDATSLDGGASTDDQGIVSYLWQQESGPNEAELTNADQALVDVAGLVEGTYSFKLTVADLQGEEDSATVTVSVKREKNQPPVAIAGPNLDLVLPSASLELDGTQSHDDKGIVDYLWTRSRDSPAAGVVIGNSNHEAVLRMVGLVPGTYKFTLNVTDAKGAYGTDSTTVTVTEDPNQLSLVHIVFQEDIKTFTEQDMKDLIMPLAVMIGVNNEDVSIQSITQTDTNMLNVVFLAFNKTSHKPLPGPEVLKRLKSKDIMSQSALLKYNVLEYDTIVCQKNCSGHGHCDLYTKRCVCETFWMENFFRVKLQDGESNCDWSILYVIIVCFLIVVGVGVVIWLIICCCQRRKKKGRRRHRYTLLEEQDNHEVMEMLPKMGNGKQSSSIMISESGDDSDDETTVFDIKRQDRNGSKPTNGYVTGKHKSTRLPHRTTEKL